LIALGDRLLDLAIAPGYSRLGFSLREPTWRHRSPSLRGRTVIVTGASSGIGEAMAELLARRGAQVRMVVRDRGRGEAARERLDAACAGSFDLDVCDISDLEQATELGRRLRSNGREIAGVIHNAGVLTHERERSAQGHELTFATSVLGPLALTIAIRPTLEAARAAVVVFVSSGGMLTARLDPDDPELDRRDFDGPRFYAHAKRAQVVLAETLAERWPGIGFASMHPGWVDTPGLASSLPGFHRLTRPLLRTPQQGADTAAWLVGGPHAFACPGRFWHDRRPRPTHLLPWTRESDTERERLWRRLIQDLADYEPEA
jgi:NAD(P)-dependent dehydrogenase (short-subunit alcohol dehydrogenase family)